MAVTAHNNNNNNETLRFKISESLQYRDIVLYMIYYYNILLLLRCVGNSYDTGDNIITINYL